ncbi:MAG: hypothetical protein EHM85_03150 [Desulfobacteraceae bacterium]|nr:MAG: hypothetical protein EHM85_03150 [Desulfobacteraceae bacterium]
MEMSKSKKFLYTAIILLALLSVLFVFDEIDNNRHKKPEDLKALYPESFTFFDLGANAELSDGITKRLSGELGSYAVEKMTTLDLIIRDRVFFNKYFPKLFELHYKFNDETGARIEHNITNLVFRYPQKENTAFDNVKLVFSNYSKKPLLFSIISRKREADITDTLKDKYGEPAVINWDDAKSLSLLWEKSGDYLVFSKISERGAFKYSIMIYFVNNMENLLRIEQNESKKNEEERKKAGKTAF